MESRYTTIAGRYTPLFCEHEHQVRRHSPGRVLRTYRTHCVVEMVCVRCGHKHVALVDRLPKGWNIYFIEAHRVGGPSPFPGIDLLDDTEHFVVLAANREDAHDLARQLEEVSFAGLTTAIDIF